MIVKFKKSDKKLFTSNWKQGINLIFMYNIYFKLYKIVLYVIFFSHINYPKKGFSTQHCCRPLIIRDFVKSCFFPYAMARNGKIMFCVNVSLEIFFCVKVWSSTAFVVPLEDIYNCVILYSHMARAPGIVTISPMLSCATKKCGKG